MSDGTINFPERVSHPDTPTSGRVKFYAYDDGASVEPYYKLDDGSENTLKGPQGDQGIQGVQGIQGIQGEIGPTGPMTVEAIFSFTGTATLPNVTNKQVVISNTANISATGDCFLMVSLAYKGHSGNNDMEFDIQFDGNILLPEFAEEPKDQSNPQSNWRTFNFDLGNVTAGNKALNLRFSKETAGGTAQLKGYTAILIRYS